MFGHTLRVIYQDKQIHSARELFDGEFGGRVKAALPFRFASEDGNGRYEVPSAKHLINVEGVQEADGTSSLNRAEATVVTNLVLAIKAAGFAAADIAVLTGYAAQGKELTRQAENNGWSKVRILTVDTSQGGEAKFLIISLVSSQGSATFMNNKSRANVATSRQQEALFFVGHWKFWKGLTTGYMAEILQDCDQHSGDISPHPFVVNRHDG